MNIMDIDGYKTAIAHDPDIKLYRGEFIELNGGADFYGADVETLRKEGETSLHVFLTMCQENSIKPFQIISGKTNVSIPLELHAKLAQGAAAELLRPYWGCPDIDILEPVDSPTEPTLIADELDASTKQTEPDQYTSNRLSGWLRRRNIIPALFQPFGPDRSHPP